MNQELIVYVDEEGRPTGETAEKLAAHHANTKLHLAFSCYVFDEDANLLVTQRALSKKVWPGVWTNSVCGHPAPGESLEAAIRRRLDYELNMEAEDLQVVLPKYRYKTPPFQNIIENEFCPVFFARAKTSPKPNPDEVESVRWIGWQDFIKEAEQDEENVWSWWCKDQLQQLKGNSRIAGYI